MEDYVSTAAVVIASATAVWGVVQWRRQMVVGRKMELAEDALSAFYEARDIVTAARNPGSFGGEGRSWRDAETQEDKSLELVKVDMYYAPAERLLNRGEFFARFRSLQYQFQAVFGPQTRAHFEAVLNARDSIIVSSQMLAKEMWHAIRHDRDMIEEKTRKRWEADIWNAGNDDEMGRSVDAAVREIEAICRPVLTKWFAP